MVWQQKVITLKPCSRGFHLITDEIETQLPELKRISVGLAHLFIQHTSASLSINENADPRVRSDMEAHLNRMIPEGAPYFQHNDEGDDDMPAHLKALCIGTALSIPITDGRLNLGIWQGVYLGEHRNQGGKRRLLITLTGEGY